MCLAERPSPLVNGEFVSPMCPVSSPFLFRMWSPSKSCFKRSLQAATYALTYGRIILYFFCSIKKSEVHVLYYCVSSTFTYCPVTIKIRSCTLPILLSVISNCIDFDCNFWLLAGTNALCAPCVNCWAFREVWIICDPCMHSVSPSLLCASYGAIVYKFSWYSKSKYRSINCDTFYAYISHFIVIFPKLRFSKT